MYSKLLLYPKLFTSIDQVSFSRATWAQESKSPSSSTVEMIFLISFKIEWSIDKLGLHMGLVFLIQAEINLTGTLSSLTLTILPTKCSLLLAICISIFVISKDFSRTDLFVILSSRTLSNLIFKILLRHLVWNTSSFFSSFLWSLNFRSPKEEELTVLPWKFCSYYVDLPNQHSKRNLAHPSLSLLFLFFVVYRTCRIDYI